ncbi:carbohydrate ABC transporter membrane protein 2 (CUT1 family) [Hydrogenispora ethanolica]|uniref:Carbohydrate ABC transporter membrane protein 2 (CUT1 family) n=1 Tax=Hydrogenispora ethanolica TaxID=1082276 RepID=A0A4R1S816_HYDET|nr:carbohydrate ABC transporter permease [Hydrogenispora ethanolica]TCL75244.1 carbohydrate ABC transporter membrane protein 2 (CUT1 family) [Hydrogenispora ethanolica]
MSMNGAALVPRIGPARMARLKRLLFVAARVILLALFLVAALLPLYWVVVTSLKGGREIYAFPIRYLPERFNLENYAYLFKISNFQLYFRNSVFVSLMGSAGALFISMLSGYALSRFRAKRVRLMFLLGMYFTQIIPTYMIMTPLYSFLAQLGLSDNLMTLSVIYIGMMIAFSTIMGSGFFAMVPVSVEEAAQIDGCSRFQALFQIVVPLVLPGLAAIFSFAFVNIWNELFLAVMFMSSEQHMTVPAALNSFISKAGVSWGVLSAGIVVALLPTLIVFAFAQKYIVVGLTEGAIKE